MVKAFIFVWNLENPTPENIKPNRIIICDERVSFKEIVVTCYNQLQIYNKNFSFIELLGGVWFADGI